MATGLLGVLLRLLGHVQVLRIYPYSGIQLMSFDRMSEAWKRQTGAERCGMQSCRRQLIA
jgi:hypothetical protein